MIEIRAMVIAGKINFTENIYDVGIIICGLRFANFVYNVWRFKEIKWREDA
jgi:hypothetical protein